MKGVQEKLAEKAKECSRANSTLPKLYKAVKDAEPSRRNVRNGYYQRRNK